MHATGGGVYEVVTEEGERVSASLRGRLKREPRTGGGVVIGDRVRLAGEEGSRTIEEVEPRANALTRRGGRARDAKVLATNLSEVLAVVSAVEPRASLELIDRLLAVGEASGFHPRLVVNKTDLEEAGRVAEELVRLYEGIGYEVHRVSARTGEGLERLTRRMCEGTSALMGPSGVGKSSLLNAIDPRLGLRTGELSRKTGTGKHTTVSARLIRLSCGGLVADTPGIGDVGVWRLAPEEVGGCFPEFAGPAGECRFRGCAHVTEPDCGVREALQDGRVPESRYRSYLKLREEAGASEA